MKIGIHISDSFRNSFSDKWISYCENSNIQFKIIDCYSSDIINQIKDCDIIMWHHHQANIRDVLLAKHLLYALEHSGKIVFPNFKTAWHFDDKVGQKFLLEAIGAPLVPSYVFYTRQEALKWIRSTSFPKVFKLRGGAASSNVRLVRNKYEALLLVNKAFKRGFLQYNRWRGLKEKIYRYRNGKDDLVEVLRGIKSLIYLKEFARKYHREKGYVYFQDFMPDNKFDIRVIVIGNKSFAIKRFVRKNDFRASGSGFIEYDKVNFDINTIKLAFELSSKLQSQCIAFDFVYSGKQPLLLEISYGFASEVYLKCPGYWDSDLNWHQEYFNPHGWMIDNIIKEFSCVPQKVF